jgi:hypothetical protein
MEISIEVAALAAIGLIIFAIKTWLLKGDLFNPGLIYAIINSLFFVVFAFGPYTYLGKIEPAYYLAYVAIIYAFVGGIFWGEKTPTKSHFKDLNLKRKNLYLLAVLVIVPILAQAVLSGVVSGDVSLEEAARSNLERAARVQANRENVNLISHISKNVLQSFVEIATGIFIANIIQKKGWSKVLFLSLWILASIINSLALNSRTILLMSVLTFIIPIYTIEKSKLFTWFKEKAALKTLFRKNLKRILIFLIIVPLLVTVISNARSSVRDTRNSTVNESRVQFLEMAYVAKKKPWFYSFSRDLPESLVAPVSELSMYAGGTVASGGVISRIANTTEIHTWGLRYFSVFHRILSNFGIDGGFSDWARDNFYKVTEITMREMPIVKAGWFSDPGNLILDFGYVGGVIASLFNGWVIGWLYSRFPETTPVLRSMVISVLAIAMLLSPAFNYFGGDLYRFITFSFLMHMVITRYRKKRKRSNYAVYWQGKIK